MDEVFYSYYEDSKFKKLFEEYLKVITDPNEKKKYLEDKKLLDKWIEREGRLGREEAGEGDPGSGSQVLTTTVPPRTLSVLPGFSVSVTRKRYHDYAFTKNLIFINFTHHESIPPAKSRRKCHGHSHSHSHSHSPADTTIGNVKTTGDIKKDKLSNDYWAIPYSLAPPEKFQKTKVYCIVFGTGTLNKSRKNDNFKTTLIRTAFQAIEENFDENLHFDDFKILDTPYFDNAPVQHMEKEHTTPETDTQPLQQMKDEDLVKEHSSLPNLEEILKAKQYIDPFFNVLVETLPFYQVHIREGPIGDLCGRRLNVPQMSLQQTSNTISILIHQPNLPQHSINLTTQPHLQIGNPPTSFSNVCHPNPPTENPSQVIIGTFPSNDQQYIFTFQFNNPLHLSSISSSPSNTLLKFRKSSLQYYKYIR